MRQLIRAAAPIALGAAFLIPLAGCGESEAELQSKTVVKDSMEEAALKEVGILYKSVIDQTGRSPKSVRDFAKDGVGYAFGYDLLNRGDLVAFWNATLSPSDSGTILAYEKKAPESGGYVLMQDGVTVKKMTAEEFKAAPKAGTAPGAAATK